MSGPTTKMKSEGEWKIETLRAHAPLILRDAEMFKEIGRYPYAVMLPDELNPGDYEADATDISAQFCGFPVVGGDRFALLVGVRW